MVELQQCVYAVVPVGFGRAGRRFFFAVVQGVSASVGGGGGGASKFILLGAPKFLETALCVHCRKTVSDASCHKLRGRTVIFSNGQDKK